jgi:hypothetical protein
MKIKTFSYSVLALLAVGQALAGEAAASAWGPVTNKVQMAISIVRPGTHFVRNFSVDGGTNGYQVPPVVEGEKSEIKVGQPFSMLVRLRNLSTNDTFYIGCQGVIPDEDRGLACVVISPSGRDVSPSMATNYDKPILLPGHSFGATAGPNETAEFEFPLSELLGGNVVPLNQLCKLEEIGTYKITARKLIDAKGGKEFMLTSNTLYVSVVPNK